MFVKAALVKEDLHDGKRLIEALDKANFKVQAALWFYLADSDEWRLYISSPFVEKEGPRKSYNFIQKILARLAPPSSFSLTDITVLSPSSNLVKLMRVAVRTGPGISGIRFTRNVINNTLIEDAYIYRIV